MTHFILWRRENKYCPSWVQDSDMKILSEDVFGWGQVCVNELIQISFLLTPNSNIAWIKLVNDVPLPTSDEWLWRRRQERQESSRLGNSRKNCTDCAHVIITGSQVIQNFKSGEHCWTVMRFFQGKGREVQSMLFISSQTGWINGECSGKAWMVPWTLPALLRNCPD